jgi:hypothetical protein
LRAAELSTEANEENEGIGRWLERSGGVVEQWSDEALERWIGGWKAGAGFLHALDRCKNLQKLATGSPYLKKIVYRGANGDKGD